MIFIVLAWLWYNISPVNFWHLYNLIKPSVQDFNRFMIPCISNRLHQYCLVNVRLKIWKLNRVNIETLNFYLKLLLVIVEGSGGSKNRISLFWKISLRCTRCKKLHEKIFYYPKLWFFENRDLHMYINKAKKREKLQQVHSFGQLICWGLEISFVGYLTSVWSFTNLM